MGTLSTIVFGAHSDVGLVRKENQDSYGAFPDGDGLEPQKGRLFLVADGMGGHRGGGEASRLAVRIIRDTFLNADGRTTPDLLRRAFQLANEAIYRESLDTLPPAIMGSTCTALLIADDRACVAHVGDSRAYRLSGSTFRQLTEDHSVVAEMQRHGLLGKEVAASHPERSQITRALGVKGDVKVDIIDEIPLGESDTFLLCTDGLSNAVSEEEMQRALASHAPDEACRSLVSLAVSRGGADNITAQVVHVERSLTFGDRLHELFRPRKDAGKKT